MSFYALKDSQGFPIPGTMIKSLKNPGTNYLKLGNSKKSFVPPCFSIDGGYGTSNGAFLDYIIRITDYTPGKYIISGFFESRLNAAGNPIGPACKNMAVINEDGSADNTFVSRINTPFNVSRVIQLLPLPDGKVFVENRTTTTTLNYDGALRSTCFFRVNANGTYDSTFVVPPNFDVMAPLTALVLLNSGKYLIAGSTNSNIMVLNTNGSIDVNNAINFGGILPKIIKLANGKLIAYGTFTTANGQSYNRIARFNTDLTIDTSFTIGTGFNNTVTIVKEIENGQLIISGSFSQYNGTTVSPLIILNEDGSLDPTFRISGLFTNRPLDIEKIGSRYLLSGLTNFGNFKTVPPIVAITEKGDYDEEFKVADITNGSSDTTIYKFTKAANNKLFIAGEFSKVNDKFQRSITRIDEDGDPDFCDVKKSELRHPKGLRFFVKKAPTGDYVPNSLIASKTSPHHSYDEIKVVR